MRFLALGGNAGRRIRAFDWSTTPLGPISGWSVPLRTAVSLMVCSRFPKAIAWGPELITLYNDAFRPILGDKPEALGRPFSAVWRETWPEVGPIVARVFAGEATFFEDFPLTVLRSEQPELAYFTFCFSPILDEHGRVAGMMDTVMETTGKVQAEARLSTVNRELTHRIKNTLAIVGSIAKQTLKSSVTLDQASRALTQRLQALAATHAVLSVGNRIEADIADVVAATLRAHVSDSARWSMSGPHATLPERQALSLSLAVNELATNAVKHGALQRQGRVEIVWALSAAGGFSFSWVEAGGPPVFPPARKSFGTVLLESIVPQDLGGTAELSFDPAGLRYQLTGQLTGTRELAET
jgi:two-component sensor histidine kinase